ncbi:MAG TPA: hypothetical protein PK037_07880 [Saprospiraceae bacterium]|nr:hypothetical protein [Saprospiraceae bacterium]
MKVLMITIFFYFAFCSCTDNNYNIVRHELTNYYVQQNFETYKTVYDELGKSVDDMVLRHIESVRGQIGNEYQIDSFIIFNKERSKLFTTINTSLKKNYGASDLIQTLYGVKIKDRWYLFFGYNLIAMRDGYKKDKFKPLTWEELSYMAREQFFRQFISFDGNSSLVIHEDALNKFINAENIGGTRVSANGTEEVRLLRLYNYKQSRVIDIIEYKELLEHKVDSIEYEESQYDNEFHQDQIINFEQPVFDSKQWKEFVKRKNGT